MHTTETLTSAAISGTLILLDIDPTKLLDTPPPTEWAAILKIGFWLIFTAIGTAFGQLFKAWTALQLAKIELEMAKVMERIRKITEKTEA